MQVTLYYAHTIDSVFLFRRHMGATMLVVVAESAFS